MADIVVTGSTVLPGAGAVVDTTHLSAAAISAGQLVFLNSSNAWQLTNAATALGAAAKGTIGIALNSALAAGAYIAVQTGGVISMTTTAAMTPRSPIVASGAVAGNLAPVADLVTNIATWFPVVVGVPLTATTLQLQPLATGI
jgi:hypothetical protein